MLLDVPFAEKDQAKALGARWNPAEKKWYVPDELTADLTQFQKWLTPNQNSHALTPTDNTLSLALEEPTADNAEKGVSLSQFMAQVQRSLRLAFPGAVWIKAEIVNISERRGHFYFELSETNEAGQVLATCRAMIWQGQAQRILQQFKQATGSDLQAGQKILLLAEVSFHEKFGFSMVIQDIDPAFTLGELEANLNQLRQQLIKEQLYDKNKRFKVPLDFFRVAVIAPPGAAGLGDFRADADLLHQQKLCEFNYFYSAFQGDHVESEMLMAFEAFEAMHEAKPFDALVIIRGGGAKLDLNPLNLYSLARWIAQSSLPVLTGIGHERDSTILDEVACQRFDTPSKVVGAIRHAIFNQAQTAQGHWLQIEKSSLAYIQKQQQKLQRLDQTVQQKSVEALHKWREKLTPLHFQIQRESQGFMADSEAKLEKLIQQVMSLVERDLYLQKQTVELAYKSIQDNQLKPLALAKNQIQQWIAFILSSGPKSQMQRGFAMVSNSQGQILKTSEQAQQQTHLNLKFIDGDVSVTVNATAQKEKP